MGVFDEAGEKIGVLTSGTYSPLLKVGIGMAYVQASNSQEGNTVSVKIRDKTAKARIVAFPFYNPEKYGYKRLPVK
jgi:aminomethyltransferase